MLLEMYGVGKIVWIRVFFGENIVCGLKEVLDKIFREEVRFLRIAFSFSRRLGSILGGWVCSFLVFSSGRVWG